MNVSVFGLGYVGSVSAASFAADGHTVMGVDVNADKVASLNAARSPIVETDLDNMIRDNVAAGRLSATTSTADAVAQSDLSLICVGTPSRKNGSLDLAYLERVAEQIGEALRTKSGYHVVVVRSTVLPGTTHDVVIPALERTSGKNYGVDFGVTVNPEFLREGTAIHDFRNPPLTLVGHNYRSDAEPTTALYAKVEAPVVSTSIRTAEMIKYASNTWHALKVSFANEIGNLCKRLQIDSHDVMDIFCRDEKLNLSSYYLKPGFAFGGSCLPKDVRALQYRAKEVDLDMPVIQSILGEQSPAGAARHRRDCRDRSEARRPAGLQLQGRDRRSARKPDRHPRRSPPRQGLSARDLRQERLHRQAGGGQQDLYQRADSSPVVITSRLGRRGPAGCGRDRGGKCRSGIFRCAHPYSRGPDRPRPRAGEDSARTDQGRLSRDLLVTGWDTTAPGTMRFLRSVSQMNGRLAVS